MRNFPVFVILVGVLSLRVEAGSPSNRSGRQVDLFDEDISRLQQGSVSHQYTDGSEFGYARGPPPPLSSFNVGSLDGYQPGRAPGSYSGDPPSFSSSYFSDLDYSGYYPGFSSGPSQNYLHYPPSGSSSGGMGAPPPPGMMMSSQQPLSMLVNPPSSAGSHGITISSPSGSMMMSSTSSGYKPGKSPPNSFGYYPYPGSSSSSSSASAAASAGDSSSSASAAAASSSGGYPYGWGPPPPPPDYGWGPPPPAPPHPGHQPPKPVPEFNFQFSLKPSSFGWNTSYNVPCGSYKIYPNVAAHLRLSTQAVLPKPPSNMGPGDRRKRSSGYFDPFQSSNAHHHHHHPSQTGRSLHYSPYHQQQFSALKPTFRPRMCRWNFDAVGGCKLNFRCTWFQLPALFHCDENYLHVTDNTVFLDSKFCGNRRPRQELTSTSDRLTLTFKSKGAALPASFDCTVLCSGPNDIPSLTSPAPTESSLSSSSASPVTSPSIVVHLDSSSATTGVLVSTSTNKRNSTLIINLPSKPQLRTGNCKCGVPDGHYSSEVEGRIVGGSTMKPGESPWTAALVSKNSNRPYCGASLINNRFLLTAAHCVLNQTRKSRDASREKDFYFDVLLNEHDISQANEIAGGTIRASVAKIIVHPKYDNGTFSYDAALLRLQDPVEFNPPDYQRSSKQAAGGGFAHWYFNGFDFHSTGLRTSSRAKRFIIPEIEARAIPPKPVPICLPDPTSLRSGRGADDDDNNDDDYAVVTGWGLVTEGGVPSNEMLKARVQIFNDSTCQELYKKHNYVITESMMCAGYINGDIDSCVGDSGSPLVTEDKDRVVLTGVVSWGRGCGRKQLPGVYTKVSELMDWIQTEASDDSVWCS